MLAPHDKRRFLRRYTSQLYLLRLLQNRKITLLNPILWHDRNDAFYVDQYKKHKKAKSVLVLCCTMAKEKFHHWRVFAEGPEGVCIEFKHDAFNAIFKIENVKAKLVRYKKINAMRKFRPALEELPFLKRQPYSDEKEFRIVYLDYKKKKKAKEFDIDLNSILRITLSPWLPSSILLYATGGGAWGRATTTSILCEAFSLAMRHPRAVSSATARLTASRNAASG